jgi:hypothetical protein
VRMVSKLEINPEVFWIYFLKIKASKLTADF